MPSKFGEFRFLGGKPGVKSQVKFQAQTKDVSQQWKATTKAISCQAQGMWILEGFPLIVKDAGTWNAQDCSNSSPKRVLVRVTEDNGSDFGIFVNQDDAHNVCMIAASLAYISNSERHAYCFPALTTPMVETASMPVPWGTGGCNFLPDPT